MPPTRCARRSATRPPSAIRRRRVGQHVRRGWIHRLLQRSRGHRRAPAARHVLVWRCGVPRRPDGWIYLAGRTADWMRVDGENLAAGPIERILQRLPGVNQVAVYAVPDEQVGDQVMAALVLTEALSPKEFEELLAAQADLSPKAWPRYVRINTELPR